MKGGGCHRLAQDLVVVYGNGLGASQAGPMHEVQTRKSVTSKHEVTRVHQEAREAAGRLVLCWGSEELEKGPVSSLLSAGLRAHWMLTRHRRSSCAVILRAVATGTDVQGLVFAWW